MWMAAIKILISRTTRLSTTMTLGARTATAQKRPHYLARSPFSSEADCPFDNEPAVYQNLGEIRKSILQSALNNPNRFQPISMREDRSDRSKEVHAELIKLRLRNVYRGLDILKCPQDFVLYHQLFYYTRPKTVIELGTYTGGMAIWIADTMKLLENPCQIYSMDLDNSLLEENVKRLKPENVTYLQGDSYVIEKTFTPGFLQTVLHPWVVIEDAHVNTVNVLRHFHQFMKEGDYLIVEDTSPWTCIPSTFLTPGEDRYEETGPQLLERLKSFLREYEEYYAVDSFFTDLYGYNSSWNWHGYIKRMK